MGRSRRRRGYGGNNNGQSNGGKANKPQAAPIQTSNEQSKQPPSIYCGICGKAHDNGFPIWELPCGRRFNIRVEIPACDFCLDSKHFKDFLGLRDANGPKTTSDYLTLLARYIELYQKRRTS